MSRSINKIEKLCLVCKKKFWFWPSRARKFCSVECYKKGHKLKLTTHKRRDVGMKSWQNACPECGKPKARKAKTCHNCWHNYHHYLKGKTYVEVFGEQKAKQMKEATSKKKTGAIFSTVSKKKMSKHAKENPRGSCIPGRIVSKEERERSAERCRLRCGEKSPLWKGGITPLNKRIRGSEEYKNWRVLVFQRDNWTCQQCGERGCELHPHHILGFAEYPIMRFAVSNGVTLCKDCHKRLHGLAKKQKGA